MNPLTYIIQVAGDRVPLVVQSEPGDKLVLNVYSVKHGHFEAEIEDINDPEVYYKQFGKKDLATTLSGDGRTLKLKVIPASLSLKKADGLASQIKLTCMEQELFALKSTNTWGCFPGLSRKFTLPHTTVVTLSYLITTQTDVNHLCTCLVLDGKPLEETRTISGNVHYHSNSARVCVELEAGDHTAEVHYRTPGTCNSFPVSDWNTYNLCIEY